MSDEAKCDECDNYGEVVVSDHFLCRTCVEVASEESHEIRRELLDKYLGL